MKSEIIEPKISYLSILSKYRDSYLYPDPTSFSMSINKGNDDNSVKILDEIIFKYKKNENTINLENINNILSVECLDVVIPKSLNILREPYLWLCINEWGSSNVGTGVPTGAFARLKVVPSNNDIPFVTMRAHLLERQSPTELSEQLTFSLLTSDGEEIEVKDGIEVKDRIEVKDGIEVKDRIKVKEVKKVKDYMVITALNHNVTPGTKLYFHSLFNNVIGFYPNVYIHDLKVNNNKISLRLFVDKDPDNIDNRIGKFINKETKERIVSSKYLEVGDMLFLEYVKTNKTSGKFEILDIKDDIITINFPQTKRKFTPKKIFKIGFIKKENKGYVSQNKKDLNYKGGVIVNKVEEDKIYLKGNFESSNEYFFLKRESQISYMFRVTHI